jgi:hypothetical protein
LEVYDAKDIWRKLKVWVLFTFTLSVRTRHPFGCKHIFARLLSVPPIPSVLGDTLTLVPMELAKLSDICVVTVTIPVEEGVAFESMSVIRPVVESRTYRIPFLSMSSAVIFLNGGSIFSTEDAYDIEPFAACWRVSFTRTFVAKVGTVSICGIGCGEKYTRSDAATATVSAALRVTTKVDGL